MSSHQSFLAAFRAGDVGIARAVLAEAPELLAHSDYRISIGG